ncbi:MAG TPA: glutathione S-transferase family protein [Steroidobacteraceae bacterium]|jgi:glutathione S-transferase
MIKLYWCPKTRAMRALWMLEESGVPFERVHIDIRNQESKDNAEFRAASPQGKVPALADGPVHISDSGAICAYVADAYPAAGLAPPIGDPLRGAYLQWLMFTNSNIEPAMMEKFSGLAPNRVAHGWGDYASMMSTLREGLRKGPWILGERFSAADVMLGTAVYFLDTFKILGDEPVLKGYVERCMARPAAQKAFSSQT